MVCPLGSGIHRLTNFTYHVRKICRYTGYISTPKCTKFPNINTYCSCSDKCPSGCTINPYGDWLTVPEPNIQIKYFFIAKDRDGKVHDVIWEANVCSDPSPAVVCNQWANSYSNVVVCWTYGVLNSCAPPDGNYDISTLSGSGNMVWCANLGKYCNKGCGGSECDFCFACDDCGDEQHFSNTSVT